MWGFSCCPKRDSFFLAWYTSKTNTDMLDKCCKVIIFIEKRKKSKICLENLTKVNMIAEFSFGSCRCGDVKCRFCGTCEMWKTRNLFSGISKNVCSVEYVTRINLDTLFFERVHS